MSVPLSYLGIVLIWSTTPLAVKWSTEGSSFIFAITSRIWLATLLSFAIMVLLKKRFSWNKQAIHAYLASATGLYGAMMCIYWSSQYIPSGVMSVIFGTSPLVTGIIAAIWIGEKSLGWLKLFGMLMGLIGLYLIFMQGPVMGEFAAQGIFFQVLGVFIHSFSLVWIKSLKPDMPALSMTSGGMMFACVPYTLTWWLLGGEIPTLGVDTVWAIIYLAIVGSVFAFVMMFYVIKHVDASTVALIPLITPVLSLTIGKYLNSEVINMSILIGASLILAGLFFYNWNLLRNIFSFAKSGINRLLPLFGCCWSIRK